MGGVQVVVPGACYLEMIVAGCTTFVGGGLSARFVLARAVVLRSPGSKKDASKQSHDIALNVWRQ